MVSAPASFDLRSYFQSLANSRFANIDKLPVPVQFSEIRAGNLPDGQPYIVKIFKERKFFEIEILALRSLAGTGRVCPVIFDSTQIPEISNLHFIVKPRLEVLRYDSSTIRLLERCAQLAGISEALFSQRWRDLDTKEGNEGLNSEGHLWRYDLDGVFCEAFFSPKYDDQSHLPEEAQAIRKARSSLEYLFSEENEVSSLALRLSRLLGKPSHDLVRQVFGLREQAGSHLVEESIRTKWLSAWENSLGNELTWQTLSPQEASLVADFFFCILAEVKPRLKIKDVRSSLLLFCAAFLQYRLDQLLHGKAAAQKYVEHLPELLGLVTAQPAKVLIPATDGSRSLRFVSAVYGGGCWKADRKGSDRYCEDWVSGRADKEPYLIILADGASGANGFHAIASIREQYECWLRSIAPRSVAKAKQQLERLIRDTQANLLSEAERLGGYCQSTLVVCMLVQDRELGPTALLARYGNSGYIVSCRKKADKEVVVLKRTSGENAISPFGAANILSPEQSIITLPLRWPGEYFFRCFSDGVAGGGDAAEDLLEGYDNIGQLSEAAATWPRDHPAIGGDDWGVAGLDLMVDEGDNATAAEHFVPASSLDQIGSIPLDQFPLSSDAVRLWRKLVESEGRRKTFQSYTLLNQFALHNSAADSRLTVKEQPQVASRPPIEVGIRPKRPPKTYLPALRDMFWWFHREPLWARITLGTAVLILLVYWPFSSPPPRPVNQPPTIPGTIQRQPPAQDPMINSKEPSLYAALSQGRPFVQQDNAPDSPIGIEPLKSFLNEVEEILTKTTWHIQIEVHTAVYKDPNKALEVSQLRGEKILKRFKSQMAKRITIVPRGCGHPEVTGKDQTKNRRLIVIKAEK